MSELLHDRRSVIKYGLALVGMGLLGVDAGCVTPPTPYQEFQNYVKRDIFWGANADLLYYVDSLSTPEGQEARDNFSYFDASGPLSYYHLIYETRKGFDLKLPDGVSVPTRPTVNFYPDRISVLSVRVNGYDSPYSLDVTTDLQIDSDGKIIEQWVGWQGPRAGSPHLTLEKVQELALKVISQPSSQLYISSDGKQYQQTDNPLKWEEHTDGSFSSSRELYSNHRIDYGFSKAGVLRIARSAR